MRFKDHALERETCRRISRRRRRHGGASRPSGAPRQGQLEDLFWWFFLGKRTPKIRPSTRDGDVRTRFGFSADLAALLAPQVQLELHEALRLRAALRHGPVFGPGRRSRRLVDARSPKRTTTAEQRVSRTRGLPDVHGAGEFGFLCDFPRGQFAARARRDHQKKRLSLCVVVAALRRLRLRRPRRQRRPAAPVVLLRKALFQGPRATVELRRRRHGPGSHVVLLRPH
mmetsp:Transcript_30464/g.98195  ORF Transcript_30464/g.98195 Transcript_30464/m.98195 type:complete len:227 (-) Transcript_30464:458-1138(-)